MTFVGDAAWLAERFEEQRTGLRSVAYRMLGSASEADAVQDAWLKISRADASEVDNHLGAAVQWHLTGELPEG